MTRKLVGWIAGKQGIGTRDTQLVRPASHPQAEFGGADWSAAFQSALQRIQEGDGTGLGQDWLEEFRRLNQVLPTPRIEEAHTRGGGRKFRPG